MYYKFVHQQYIGCQNYVFKVQDFERYSFFLSSLTHVYLSPFVLGFKKNVCLISLFLSLSFELGWCTCEALPMLGTYCHLLPVSWGQEQKTCKTFSPLVVLAVYFFVHVEKTTHKNETKNEKVSG